MVASFGCMKICYVVVGLGCLMKYCVLRKEGVECKVVFVRSLEFMCFPKLMGKQVDAGGDTYTTAEQV